MKKLETYESFLIYAWGLGMILLGGQLSILNDWLFWYPLGILTLPTFKYALYLLFPIREVMSK